MEINYWDCEYSEADEIECGTPDDPDWIWYYGCTHPQRTTPQCALNNKMDADKDDCKLLDANTESPGGENKMIESVVAALVNHQKSILNDKDAEIKRLKTRCAELVDFCIWMSGCGYDFCEHDYFIEQRDKLLKAPEDEG